MHSALVFYHYFYPDDVVSAVHYSDLCSGLVERGWAVTVMPSVRGCREEVKEYSPHEIWKGVTIRRIWRPAWRQSSGIGRLLNTLWMIARWSLMATSHRLHPDILIIGTDPVLSIVAALSWRLLKPQTRIVHWCFDLYPDAAVAAGILRRESFIVRLLTAVVKPAYAGCDLIADIGPCMRSLIRAYHPRCHTTTLVPWALEEPSLVPPSVSRERRILFGEASLGLLYSGSFGRAHGYQDILDLARLLRGTGIHLCFSVRGNCVDALRLAVTAEDTNVSFVPFTAPENLNLRLAAADVHIVSLREEWTGTVVPSKFFGALAIGRPVIFSGSPKSAIAEWIQQYGVGWLLEPGHAKDVAVQMSSLLARPEEMFRLREHCHSVYQEHFAKCHVLDQWHGELMRLMSDS